MDIFNQPNSWVNNTSHVQLPQFISSCEVSNLLDYFSDNEGLCLENDPLCQEVESESSSESDDTSFMGSFSPLKQLSRISLEDIKQLPRDISDVARRPVRRISNMIFGTSPTADSDDEIHADSRPNIDAVVDISEFTGAFWKKIFYSDKSQSVSGMRFAKTFDSMREPFAINNMAKLIRFAYPRGRIQVSMDTSDLIAANEQWNRPGKLMHIPRRGTQQIPIRAPLSLILPLFACRIRVYLNSSWKDYQDFNLQAGDAILVDAESWIYLLGQLGIAPDRLGQLGIAPGNDPPTVLLMYILFTPRQNSVDIPKLRKK